MFERLGTLSYMAPELLTPDRKSSYNSSVDMWALGCLTYFLLTGETPFKGKTNDEVFNSVIVDCCVNLPIQMFRRC